MIKERNLNNLMEMVKGLSEADQAALAEQIMKMLSKPGSAEKKEICSSMVAELSPEKPDCPHCAARATLGYIVKRGKCKGAQRFYCKSCGKYFVPTTNTAFAFTRKDAGTWKMFISMTIAGASLHSCAETCGLAYQTAFTWRHRILSAFAKNQEAVQMSGTVEVDEMLVPISYKGNHIQGTFGKRVVKPDVINDMPRAAYRRGSDNKSKSSKDKVCIFCMVQDGNKAFYAAVPGIGFMSDAMLNATVAKHIDKENTLMVADSYKTTKNYLKENGYNHMILLSNVSDNPNDHKPEIKNGLHLQHVNSMHHHIRNFLKPYYGVSSKYLSNYISLFIWLKSIQSVRQKKKANKLSVARAATPDCYVSRKHLESRPAVPMCA